MMPERLTDWFDWPGGPVPPMPPETAVVVKFRDGLEGRARKVKSLRWDHVNSPDDVVAYRYWVRVDG
jgi:hypothetical protein